MTSPNASNKQWHAGFLYAVDGVEEYLHDNDGLFCQSTRKHLDELLKSYREWLDEGIQAEA